MSIIKRIRRTALVLFGIVSAVFLWLVFLQVKQLVLYSVDWDNAIMPTMHIVHLVIVFSTLSICLSILFSIRKAETPFNRKNVAKLKTVGILLIVFELIIFLSQRIARSYFPVVLKESPTTYVSVSLSGVVVAAGLVVYCIALVFEYGISLQNQYDEIL